MRIRVEIAPHERREALEAYASHLTTAQADAIEALDDDNQEWITLEVCPTIGNSIVKLGGKVIP